MDDDFNTANGVTVLFDMAKWINSGNYDETVKDAFEKILQVFGIVFEEETLDEDIENSLKSVKQLVPTRTLRQQIVFVMS